MQLVRLAPEIINAPLGFRLKGAQLDPGNVAIASGRITSWSLEHPHALARRDAIAAGPVRL